MKPLRGMAKLTSDSGTVYLGSAEIWFTKCKSMRHGTGTFSFMSGEVYEAETSDPTLDIDGTAYKVILHTMDHHGVVKFITTGRPI